MIETLEANYVHVTYKYDLLYNVILCELNCMHIYVLCGNESKDDVMLLLSEETRV